MNVAESERIQRLDLLKRLLTSMEEEPDLGGILQRVYDIFPSLLDLDRSSILLYDEYSGGLISDTLLGVEREERDLISGMQPVDISISGLCFKEDHPILVNDCGNTDIIPQRFVEQLGLKSTLAVPIHGRGDRPLGVLRVDDTREVDRFSEADVDFFVLVGRILGTVLENAHLTEQNRKAERDLRELNEKLEDRIAERTEELKEAKAELERRIELSRKAERERRVMAELALELVDADTAENLAQAIRKATIQLFDWDAFIFSERMEKSEHFLRVLAVDTFEGRRTDLDHQLYPPRPYKTRAELHRGEPLLLYNDSSESLKMNTFGDESRVSATLLYAPVSFGGKLYGIISVQSYEKRKWDETDLAVLEALGGLVAPALRRLQAERSLLKYITQRKRAERVQRVMYEISEAAHREGSLSALFAAIQRHLRTIIYAENFFVALAHEDGTKISFPFSIDSRDHYDPAPRALPRSLSARIIRNKKPILLDRAGYRRMVETHEIDSFGHEPASWMGVPLIIEDKVLGVVAVQSYSEEFVHTEEDLSILTFVSGQIAAAIEHKRIQESMRQSEERYALAARGTNDGLWDWYLSEDLVFFSIRWKEMLGYGEEEIGRSPEEWFVRVHPQDLPELRRLLDAYVASAEEHFRHEHRMMHKDGKYRWMLCRGAAVRDEEGRAVRIAGSISDVTDRREAQEQLARAAFYDALTGLPNRALFADRLERCLSRARRHRDYLFAVMFLDLDRFKVVNDTLGHPVGDALLRQVGERLASHLREADTVARLGGDEFTILLDGLHDAKEVFRIAERVLESLSAPFSIGSREVFTAASIGIALNTTSYGQVEEVLRDADTALYRAKQTGRGRYVIFDQEMHRQMVVAIELEDRIRQALAKDRFRLNYQAIFSLASRELVGFEALLRLEDPKHGLLLPGQFLALAEDSGLIVPIGEWVIEEVMRQMAKWRKQHSQFESHFVSVNLSPRQFADAGLGARVEEALGRHGVDPRQLSFEITQSTILQRPESVSTTLRRWHELGINILIDDFHLGDKSIYDLDRHPIDFLKIDRVLVRSVHNADSDKAIIRAILNVADAMKLRVITQGAETEQEVEDLRQLGCDLVQGFYLSKPVSADEAGRMIDGGIRLAD